MPKIIWTRLSFGLHEVEFKFSPKTWVKIQCKEILVQSNKIELNLIDYSVCLHP